MPVYIQGRDEPPTDEERKKLDTFVGVSREEQRRPCRDVESPRRGLLRVLPRLEPGARGSIGYARAARWDVFGLGTYEHTAVEVELS